MNSDDLCLMSECLRLCESRPMLWNGAAHAELSVPTLHGHSITWTVWFLSVQCLNVRCVLWSFVKLNWLV